jgi:hypothetical protein
MLTGFLLFLILVSSLSILLALKHKTGYRLYFSVVKKEELLENVFDRKFWTIKQVYFTRRGSWRAVESLSQYGKWKYNSWIDIHCMNHMSPGGQSGIWFITDWEIECPLWLWTFKECLLQKQKMAPRTLQNMETTDPFQSDTITFTDQAGVATTPCTYIRQISSLNFDQSIRYTIPIKFFVLFLS